MSSKSANVLSTASVGGRLSWYKKKMRLYFLEDKPIAYKAQALRGNVVKGDDLVAYAANAAHVPESTIRMAKDALFQAVNYFCTQGHLVQVPNLGGFKVVSNVKTMDSMEALNAAGVDAVRKKRLRWFPKAGIAQLGRISNISLTENKELSKMALAAPDPPLHEEGSEGSDARP